MEIIREGPSASRPPVLDGKYYSYWKPVPKSEVVGYEPPMITVDGVSVPKSEVVGLMLKNKHRLGMLEG
ncbi:gag-pol polyprotein [Cucumis melo var. makuwa]|uniref:Gag-pol polyprotein n=1 Tax=Cucumis melo var. makuwa TaxID=1194695 RepID=A0A5A7TK88_CUCMM|nr:gag-pol polyprotein [Cucumis melo var. makuwa]TYK26732.1 gag-pol polyprotein [Cucumis melo var. makuwa]